MRAAVYRRFGGPDAVRVEQVPQPAIGPDDLLVRVHASTVSAADHRARSRDIPRGLWLMAAFGIGAFRPKRRVLGMDIAGVVEAVGAGVTDFAPGDRVIAMLGGRFGGHAEYARVGRGQAVARIPAGMAVEDAVTLVFGGLTARAFLAKVALGPGVRVLVNGASGAVGSAAVQLAAHAGADVTAVCSGRNRELVTSLGAARAIDYTAADFADSAERYDVIVDCVGNASYRRVRHLLTAHGALLLVLADLPALLLAPVRSRRSGRLVVVDGAKPTADDLAFLAGLARSGTFRAVRDRSYDLADIAEAHRYVDTGHKRGAVVLRVAADDPAAARASTPASTWTPTSTPTSASTSTPSSASATTSNEASS